MKVNVHTFEDGKIAYTTGRISVAINKKEPINVETVEIEKEVAQEFLDNPPDVKGEERLKVLKNLEEKDKKDKEQKEEKEAKFKV